MTFGVRSGSSSSSTAWTSLQPERRTCWPGRPTTSGSKPWGSRTSASAPTLTFSQQTFAESLKLPFPLLSDFPDRKVMRSYGVFDEKSMTAVRSFFLIDPQGIIRKKWIIENDTTTVVYGDTLLPGIQEVIGKR